MVIGTVSEAKIQYPRTPQSLLTSRVTLSQTDTIISAQGDLMPFASKTKALPDLTSTIGSSLWEWVLDRTTRHLLNIVLQRLRATQLAITLSYRCDTADLRLYMEADLIPRADGCVEIVSRTLDSEQTSVANLAKGTSGTEELLRICSWCKRIHRGEWVQPELAIKWLRLFEGSSLPELSHGICEDCREPMLASIRNRRGEK